MFQYSMYCFGKYKANIATKERNQQALRQDSSRTLTGLQMGKPHNRRRLTKFFHDLQIMFGVVEYSRLLAGINQISMSPRKHYLHTFWPPP